MNWAKILVFIVPLMFFEHSAAAWKTSTKKDRMTGERSAYAISASVKPLEEMPFPYHDIKSWIGFGCKKESKWAYIGFSSHPNPTNSDTEDGYNIITERVKWDDTVISTKFIQNWGSKFLHFMDYGQSIQKILAKNSLMLELHWYGERVTYFQYSLRGSSSAIQEARHLCRLPY